MYEEDRKNPMTAGSLGLPADEQLMGNNTDPQGDSVEGNVLTFKNPNAGGNTIAMQAFVQDPKANPLMNDSGKINIYSAALDTYIQNHDFPADDKANATPIPSYAKEWWGADTRTSDYPLCGFDFHYRGRQHSAWGNIDTLLELNPQELWINPTDAQSRGIASGDTVKIKSMPVDGYCSGGVTTMQAKVTPKVIPGSVCFPHAAWHNADMSGATPDDRVDSGGCDNTLSSHRGSMYAKGNATKTYLVQISKA
jgi:Tat-targeted selenate reductase subunit YnfE